MHSSTSNSEFVRPIPARPWRGILAATLALTLAATAAWEFRARAHGYAPRLNDTADLWAEKRREVQSDSLVLLGTSRMLFDVDLDVLERAFGRRPVQLALVGSTPFPILADLAQDENFCGTVVLDLVPAMFMAPDGFLMESSLKALNRHRQWTPAQRWSHELAVQLEQHFAFLNQEDLTLAKLLENIELPERASFHAPPKLPPYFYSLDRDRRARMTEQAATIGHPVQQTVVNGWLPLFTPPPPPAHIPPEKFRAMMGRAIEVRFAETARHIAAIRARGGRVVVVRLPVQGPLLQRENELAPFDPTWGRLIGESELAAVNFADHSELNSFILPEWSHLSAPDSVEFTRRLVPHLQQALHRETRLVAQRAGTVSTGAQ